jgi:hypothetical protein
MILARILHDPGLSVGLVTRNPTSPPGEPLDTAVGEDKIPENPVLALPRNTADRVFMNSKPSPKAPLPPPQRMSMPNCKHPRVQIVTRDEDSEFVQCKECGEIFESSEFKDMAIEEHIPLETESEEA